MADFWSAAGFSTPPTFDDKPAGPPAAPAPIPIPAAVTPAAPAGPAKAAASLAAAPSRSPAGPAANPSARSPVKAPAAPARKSFTPPVEDEFDDTSMDQPRRKKPVLALVLLVLVGGGGFAVYKYVLNVPAPAAADVVAKPPAKPTDPLLEFLLSDEPTPAARPGKPTASGPATPPAPAAPREATATPAEPVAPPAPAPLRTDPETDAATSGLRLEAIDGKTCTINGQTYQPGDKVEGYVVQTISADRVTLRSGRTLVELKVQK